jgi:hypothetical protein
MGTLAWYKEQCLSGEITWCHHQQCPSQNLRSVVQDQAPCLWIGKGCIWPILKCSCTREIACNFWLAGKSEAGGVCANIQAHKQAFGSGFYGVIFHLKNIYFWWICREFFVMSKRDKWYYFSDNYNRIMDDGRASDDGRWTMDEHRTCIELYQENGSTMNIQQIQSPHLSICHHITNKNIFMSQIGSYTTKQTMVASRTYLPQNSICSSCHWQGER